MRGIRTSVCPIDNGGHCGLGMRASLSPHYPEYPGFAIGMKCPVKRCDPAHDRPTEQCVQQRQQQDVASALSVSQDGWQEIDYDRSGNRNAL